MRIKKENALKIIHLKKYNEKLADTKEIKEDQHDEEDTKMKEKVGEERTFEENNKIQGEEGIHRCTECDAVFTLKSSVSSHKFS